MSLVYISIVMTLLQWLI